MIKKYFSLHLINQTITIGSHIIDELVKGSYSSYLSSLDEFREDIKAKLRILKNNANRTKLDNSFIKSLQSLYKFVSHIIENTMVLNYTLLYI